MVFGNYNAWRSHPIANPKLYQAFPGFKWAVGIFAVYCSGEWVYDSLA
jgi:singapore isolate B (sub-type 7) whole genome shotgun sequence assembly, scaffold_14